MRFGVCMPIEQAEFIAKLGFDYLEVSVVGLAEMTEAQFADFLQKNEAAPIHAEAANCMFPGSIKLTGDNVDFEAIQTYVNHAIGRLAQAGIARQPEAESKIRTTLMIGLVFIETAIIYALLVVILIIFVL